MDWPRSVTAIWKALLEWGSASLPSAVISTIQSDFHDHKDLLSSSSLRVWFNIIHFELIFWWYKKVEIYSFFSESLTLLQNKVLKKALDPLERELQQLWATCGYWVQQPGLLQAQDARLTTDQFSAPERGSKDCLFLLGPSSTWTWQQVCLAYFQNLASILLAYSTVRD